MTGGLRDHGGGVDAAAERFGGARADWIDLSTGINPQAYPLPPIADHFWRDLPDAAAQDALVAAACEFWRVPSDLGVLPAPGVSVLIAMLPRLAARGMVCIPGPTYNEHAAAFAAEGWQIRTEGAAMAQVVVHPNNPDGRVWTAEEVIANHRAITIIDESFCDVCPDASLIDLARHPGVIVLKGLGKFWGLAGLRLGFAIARPVTLKRLAEMMGPWAVSGPAQAVGAAALADHAWAADKRARLVSDSARLDALMTDFGASNPRGTTLFRLYDVGNAIVLQERLAKDHIWTRAFPWSDSALRLGMPGTTAEWDRLETALEG